MASLVDRLLKAGSASSASIISESTFFNDKEMVTTDLPILNAAFSADINGGFTSGLTVLAGESKTFKSALALYCMKAYLDKYKDAIAIFYDSEFGITNDYLKTFGLDTSRIVHIPVEHVEQLKFDFVKKLEEIKKGDKVFIMVDSIGQIASKKETDDAMDEKSVADMTRAKAIRSLLRLVTVQLTLKEIPCFMINHVYSSIGLFPSTVIPGGTAVTYASSSIFVITKSQEKNSDGELEGWNFTINSFKSRYVREKAKFPFKVLYEGFIQKYSGVLDLALESGHVIKPSNGWYQLVDKETGEVAEGKVRASATGTDEFLGKVVATKSFKEFVINKYKLGAGSPTEEELDVELSA